MYNMNTAGQVGGALCLSYGSFSSFFNSSLVSNTAGKRGGGIHIYGYSSSPSFFNMSSVTLQSNKQIDGVTTGWKGGGGLYFGRFKKDSVVLYIILARIHQNGRFFCIFSQIFGRIAIIKIVICVNIIII